MDRSSRVIAGSDAPSANGAGRRVYPYSVIPGGVESVAEIQDAVLRDPVVAGHYSLLKVSALEKTHLSRPLSAYVSFRVGTKVYWTARKLNIATGETVFLDKSGNGVRGRCGNQLSQLPMTPISEIIAQEPTPKTLDTPVTPSPAPAGIKPAPVPTEIGNLLAPQEIPTPGPTPTTITPSPSSPPVYQPIYGFPSGPVGSSPSGTGPPISPPGIMQPPATPGSPVVPILPVEFGPAPAGPTYSIVIPPFGYQPIVPLTPVIPVLYPPPPIAPGTPTAPSSPTTPGTPGTPTTPTSPSSPATPPITPITPTTPTPPETPPVIATPEPRTGILLALGLALLRLRRPRNGSVRP